eukprot:scaffold25295_cov71-Attheya_sp.AAC.4
MAVSSSRLQVKEPYRLPRNGCLFVIVFLLFYLTARNDTAFKQATIAIEVNKLQESTSNAPQHHDEYEYLWNGEKIYIETAKSFTPVTDKVTAHTYESMYGMFLLPYYHQNPTMKMLEIGLGCDMDYGPGASVAVHKKLFPKADLWVGEYDAACAEKHRNGTLNGINLLTGDQGNFATLDGWIEQSGGTFDVVIDDGGHQNCQIWNSFQKLWPTVKPGGLYFIEDMQVAKNNAYRNYETPPTCDKNLLVPEKLKEIVDILIYDTTRKSEIKYIFCQSEACVLGKKGSVNPTMKMLQIRLGCDMEYVPGASLAMLKKMSNDPDIFRRIPPIQSGLNVILCDVIALTLF